MLTDQRQHVDMVARLRPKIARQSLWVPGQRPLLVTFIASGLAFERSLTACTLCALEPVSWGPGPAQCGAPPVWVPDDVAEVAGDHEVDVQGVDQLGARQQHRHVAHCVDGVCDQHLQPSMGLIRLKARASIWMKNQRLQHSTLKRRASGFGTHLLLGCLALPWNVKEITCV